MIGNISSAFSQNDQGLAAAFASTNIANPEKQNNEPSSPPLKKEKSQSVKITISDEALKKLGLEKSKDTTNSLGSSGISKLSSEELKQVADLKSRDQEVRMHELAHMMVGGNLVRKGVSYQYQTGPDGLRYAVGGEVSIDSSAVDGDPAATIVKMEQVKRAAMAPAEPSTEDRQVAASAAETEAAARQQLLEQSTAKSQTAS